MTAFWAWLDTYDWSLLLLTWMAGVVYYFAVRAGLTR